MYLNSGPPEYEAGVLTTLLLSSVRIFCIVKFSSQCSQGFVYLDRKIDVTAAFKIIYIIFLCLKLVVVLLDYF
jgi:hypothetical protein